MAPNEVAKELSIDLRTEAGGTVFVKDKEGRSVESDWSVLDGNTVGIYFWRPDSPPCRAFTANLKDLYTKLKKEGKNFEILFLISENRMYDAYKDDMPWAASIINSKQRRDLCIKVGVASVPALLIISPEGKVIAPNARIGVLEAPENYPWPGCVDEEVISNEKMGNWCGIIAAIVAVIAFFWGFWYFRDMLNRVDLYPPIDIDANSLPGGSGGKEPPQGLGRDGEL